jgi:hypothetical protein
MTSEQLQKLFKQYKESALYHRYITNHHIEPLIKRFDDLATIKLLGQSVLNQPIYSIQIGHGKKRLLMWSQMHGNESTTTKAIFDMLNTLLGSNDDIKHILDACTILIIPILNPDGAKAYTRLNANGVDLNRDAQDVSQPESKLLREVFDDFKTHYCFNLHGQRTIFSAGTSSFPATVSFLSPAQNEACTVTQNRRVAMEVIAAMNTVLQNVIPNQVGVYDDAFNIHCVGDAFQSLHVPTILFEAGHYAQDYEREHTRGFIYMALLTALDYISNHKVHGDKAHSYFEIPGNEKCFYDLIIRNAVVQDSSDTKSQDIGILYQEVLQDNHIIFKPKVEIIGHLNGFYGHREIDAEGKAVLNLEGAPIQVGYENDFVIWNNEKISLLLK